MTRQNKRTRVLIQCSKCKQDAPDTPYRILILTGSTGNRSSRVILCPACLQMFWLVYDGFIQTRPAEKPVYIEPPFGFRAAIPYQVDRHHEAIRELKREMAGHRQSIRYLREIPDELSAPHPHP